MTMNHTFDPDDENYDLVIRLAAVTSAALLVANTQQGRNTTASYLATQTIAAAERLDAHLRRKS